MNNWTGRESFAGKKINIAEVLFVTRGVLLGDVMVAENTPPADSRSACHAPHAAALRHRV